MPLRLDVKVRRIGVWWALIRCSPLLAGQRKLLARSDRVKCMDLHPKEPWMLASLYNGNVHVWNYESQTLVKSFEVTDLPGMSSMFCINTSFMCW